MAIKIRGQTFYLVGFRNTSWRRWTKGRHSPGAGPAVAGIPLYEPNSKSVLAIESAHHYDRDQHARNALLGDFGANPRNEAFRKADSCYGDAPGDGKYVADAGFRLHGNVFSRQRPEVGTSEHNPDNALHRVHFRIN